LSAAKALIRIDGEKAVPKLIPLIAAREDWSTETVAAILREAGADLISEPLSRTILQSPKNQTARLIRFLEIAHAEFAIPTIKRVLKNSDDMEVITACLRIFQDADDLNTVRKLLKDVRWQVRLQAAVCLGRIGTEEDEDLLIQVTNDPEWWTRYRAAQALANLPSVDLERLNKIAEKHPNESARSIIRQVIAEKQVIDI
jgi:HEAT repeat protein